MGSTVARMSSVHVPFALMEALVFAAVLALGQWVEDLPEEQAKAFQTAFSRRPSCRQALGAVDLAATPLAMRSWS
jgi:hypothetical protein